MLAVETDQIGELGALLSFPTEDDTQDMIGSTLGSRRRDPSNLRDEGFFLNLLNAELKLNPEWNSVFEDLAQIKHKRGAGDTNGLEYKSVAIQFRDAVKGRKEWPVSLLPTDKN